MEQRIDRIKESLLDVIGRSPKDTLIDSQIIDISQFVEEYLDELREEVLEKFPHKEDQIADAFDWVRADVKNFQLTNRD